MQLARVYKFYKRETLIRILTDLQRTSPESLLHIYSVY
jgi:hypothetical protein